MLVVLALAMVFQSMPAAFALDDPTSNEQNPKVLICHSLNGTTFSRLSLAPSALQTAHLDAGHTYDIIEGIQSVSLGRIAVANDIAIITYDDEGEPMINWVCGDSRATTTTTTTTTTTLPPTTTTSTTTTTTLPPTTTTSTTTTTTTTTTTLPPTTTTTTTTLPPTTTTTTLPPTTTTVPATTTTLGGPTTTTSTTLAVTTTTQATTTSETKPDSTTTTIGGPCSPTDPDCLPNTGGGANLVWLLLAGLGILMFGTGFLVIADERRRGQVA